MYRKENASYAGWVVRGRKAFRIGEGENKEKKRKEESQYEQKEWNRIAKDGIDALVSTNQKNMNVNIKKWDGKERKKTTGRSEQ